MSLEEAKELEKKYKLPMPTFCLDRKSYCAKEYGALILLSKGSMGIMHTEKNRYLYQNSFNTSELAAKLGVAETTLNRNIKKLQNLDCNILKIENTKNGVVYRLNYGLETGYNDEVHKYVTIHHEMLEELIVCFKTPAIKLYCLLCYMTNEKEFTLIDEKFLCEKIGLCGDSENNKSKIRKFIQVFKKCRYVETKKENRMFWDKDKKNKINKTVKLYRLCSFDEWKKLDEEIDK
ncbi:TPA: winged helix-turn-helix transcriptional regulator [Clostridioides difficile]|nr:winged helix-turn-helix transcriptional regulator [Clostridioides difficile]